MTQKSFYSLFVLILFPLQALAWGPRGHHTICKVASRLVSEKGLYEYMHSRGDLMGYLCNIPDSAWRENTEHLKKYGDPTHYFEPDILNVKMANAPLSLEKFATSQKMSVLDAHLKAGSSWWRAEQLLRYGIAAGQKAYQMTNPSPASEPLQKTSEGISTSADVKTASTQIAEGIKPTLRNMVIAMGIMGHFVGDTVQPLHNTKDYDGYERNKGGLHGYYESDVVDAIGMDFDDLVYKRAVTDKNDQLFKLPKGIVLDAAEHTELGVVEDMRRLAIIANSQIELLFKNDKVLRPSQFVSTEKNKLKIPAERVPPAQAVKLHKAMIIEQCARAAKQLARFWDKIFVAGHRPSLNATLKYDFMHKPEFIEPDYLEPTTKEVR